MADLKISQLVQANVVNKEDLLYLIQDGVSENVSAGTLFASITDPTFSGNITFGGPAQTLYSTGRVDVSITRTDLYGGVSADPNAISNGSVLPATIFLYTEGVSATGRGLTFANSTPSSFTKTIYVKHRNNKLYLGSAQSTIYSYPPEEWVGPTGLRPFPDGLYLQKGCTYIFDVSDPSNAGNVFALSTSIDGTNTLGTRHTANITFNGTAGSAGANVVYVVPDVPTDAGGKQYLELPQGSDGQLKIINLVTTQGGKFVITSNIRNNLAIELGKTGDSAFLMYSGNAWLLIGSNPGLVTTFSGTSDDVPEGSKLYFTNARARAAISAGDGSIIYDPTTGTIRAVLSANALNLDANTNLTLGNTTIAGKLITLSNVNIAGNLVANTSISTTGNITAGNISATYFTGNGSGLTGIVASINSVAGNLNVTGNVVANTIVSPTITASIWNGIYTANVIESASNLYYTDARVYANVKPLLDSKANVADLTTANVIESASNLYYTNARVYANVIGLLNLKANVKDLTTANVIESASNLYYTNARVQEYLTNITGTLLPAIGNTIDIGSNDKPFRDLWLYGNSIKFSNSGSISQTSNNLVIVDGAGSVIVTANANARILTSSTGKIDANLIADSGITTANIPEGGANLYYSNSRVFSNIALASIDIFADVNTTTTPPTFGQALIWDGVKWKPNNVSVSSTELANIANVVVGIVGSSLNANTVSTINNFTTSNLIEGSNLYYTNARVYANVTPLLDKKANVVDLTTANVTESISNQYFTNVRAQLALQPTIAELRAAITAPVANVIYVAKNGDDNNTGHTASNALANIHVALSRATEWTTVFVKSGDYTLHNQPVTIGRRVGLVGDNLRTTTIRPEKANVDMFYVNNACYVTGFTFRDHVAPAAVFSYNPDGSAGTIITSPYIQNSSSITTTGTGMRVDGRYVSGLRSMVCDSYTQTNEGGIGIHMLHRGYTQLVSVFTICCHIAIKCESGGFCSITNSNASFGTYALYADGVSEPLYYGKLQSDTIGQDFVITNLSQRPNYGDSVLFATYNQAKCARDAGLIVDSLAFDLAYGGNSQSNFAGLQYWSQTSSAIQNQSVETLAAINYAKSLALNVIANVRITSTYQGSNVQQFATSPSLIADPASNTKVSDEFNLITNIITNGTTGVTDLIVPNSYPANTNAYVNHASNLLYRNNAFIKSEVIAYVNTTYPGFFANALNFVDVANAEARCSRDVGYILDTVRFDLLHGGNKQAVQAGTYYYNYSVDTTQINDQVVQTGAAYDYIGSVIKNVITKTKNAAYNQDKCERDAGLIVDSVLMDLAYNSNSQSTFAGLQYWSQSESAIPNQSVETIAAINYARDIARLVSANTLVSNLQSNVAQVRGITGGTVSYNKITSEFDLIANIITSGTVGVTDRIIPNSFPANTNVSINNGANLIYLNKSFIAAEVIAYVNATYPGFFANANNFVDAANAETRCSRDVGYIIDSVRFDMMHDGNRQAVQAGTYYYNYNANVTQINDQIVKTGQAYAFINGIVNKIVLGNVVAPTYQTLISQNTTAATVATSSEANVITDKINLINNIIANGPNVAPAKTPISYSAITNTNLSNAATLIFANKDFIKAETIGFVNAVLFDPPYQTEITQNTTAAPASTYATANLILQNVGLITNVITQGPSAAAPKLPIGLTANTDPNVINATTLILANRDYIKAEVIAFVNRTWSNISNGSGTYYTVKNATELVGNTSTVTLLETVFTTIPANTSVSFHQGSYISSSGHTMEYVGSGDTIATALPYLGGIPKQENEVTELRGGKVFFTSTDQRGDFRIGTGLVINRVDGTISGRTFNKALFAVMTPYMLAIEG